MLGRALPPERRTIMRLLQPLQHLTSDAERRLLSLDISHIKDSLCVIVGVFIVQRIATSRYLSYATPLPVCHFEHLGHQLLRRDISFSPHRTRILIFDVNPSLLKLLHSHVHTLQDVDRLEAGHNNRHVILRRNGDVFLIAHDSTDMSSSQKPLHKI